MKFSLEDLTSTEYLGTLLGRTSCSGDVILLEGELGAGKTSLCRGFLREFSGISDMDVPSPSYLISIQYSSPHKDNIIAYHIDPYRLSSGSVACLIDFERALKDAVLLIEWPSRLGPELTNLVRANAGRLMCVSFAGVGPQAAGRVVEVSVRDTETDWLNGIAEKWKQISSEAGEPSNKVVKRTSSSPESIFLPAGSLRASGTEVLVLGIESSCDDTAVAILKGDGTIVAQCIASQATVHQEWGGVVPKLAQEEHAKAIKQTVETCLVEAGISAKDLSAIAVTVGPGLALCLLVGVKKAMELASEFQIPIVRVHHMEAHMMVTRLPGLCSESPRFPFVTLLISGGHTMIVLTKGLGNHTVIGSTIDDSVGEAFDKTARLLGITSIPGGKELEALALTGDASKWNPPLPKPLSRTRDASLRKGADMSFAGLKTAVRMALDTAQKNATDESPFIKADLAAAFQKVCTQHLCDRLTRALHICLSGDESHPALIDAHDMKHLVVAGGVASNKTVKAAVQAVADSFGLTLCAPPPAYCTDNGVMVAWTGVERLREGLGEPAPKLKDASEVEKFCEVRPRWPLGLRHSQCVGKLNDQNLRALDRKALDMARSGKVSPQT